MISKTLDLGCSCNKVKGAIGLDGDINSHADIICDLEKILPLKDNSFKQIYCKHLLEHLDDPRMLVKEIHRISMDGARVIIEVPHFASHTAYSDLTHKRYFSFVMLNRLVNSIPHKTIKKEMTFYKTFSIFGIKFLANKNKENYERFWAYIFPAENIKFEIEIKK